MKRSLFAAFFLFTAGPLLVASPVNTQTAALVAKNIYFEQIKAQRTLDYNDLNPSLVYTARENSVNYYYIFNFSTGGFVVVSADDAVWPILGFSSESSYQTEDHSPAFNRWMEDYRQQIKIVIDHGYPATPAVAAEWQRLNTPGPLPEKSIKSALPLLQTKWDQGKYYNEFCPVANTGPDGHCWAGCVPTAMAQIMNYYRWPLHGTGSYSYNDSIYGTQSADFGNTNYRWNEMPVKLGTYNSALAELQYHLGVSVDLDYGPNGSGMHNHHAALALRTYFGYSPNTEYVFRDTCHLTWKGLILTHLDNHIPLYYAGWADTINVSGHAFVCDGYQDTTYFHFNWGWSGTDDGYYTLDNLTPGGNDFTLDHELIVNIFPDGAYPQGCSGADTLTTLSGVIDDGSGPLNDYGNNADCSWLIAPNDSVVNIKLRFLEFNLAGGDTLTVYNGGNTSDPVLLKLTGSSLHVPVTILKPKVLLHFSSDDSLTAPGFMVQDSVTVPVYCTILTTLTNQSGSITDGSGTFNYHNNNTCRWLIQPAGATAITAHFNHLQLGAGDYIDITDQQNSTLLKHLTGDTLPANITCPSGKLMILFHSDKEVTAPGWDLNYYVSSGVTEYNELSDLEVLPNPAKEFVTIKGMLVRGQKLDLEMLNSSLMCVLKKQLDADAGTFESVIDTRTLSPGLYILHLRGEKDMIIKKIVILL